ncbi:hypothetical protein SAMN04488062_10293 [Flavobacterium omnivorum]|uniref:Uncharacterized protein n=1 Tax=Flavobacterium omnivorum TaxID=178355 RepID=A0A1G7WYT3_9FLAO|nr:hypothetical protein SAMN04488062_10293 [Flavobacterium omnivorum]
MFLVLIILLKLKFFYILPQYTKKQKKQVNADEYRGNSSKRIATLTAPN